MNPPQPRWKRTNMDTNQDIQETIQRGGRLAFRVGMIATALTAALAMLDTAQFYQSYLQAYVLWIGLPLGGLGFMMIQHLTGGAWVLISRRCFEAAARTLPAMAVLFIPILFGMGTLYHHWLHPSGMHAEVIELKTEWLNKDFWIIRSVFYFAVWITLATIITRWSCRQDENGDPKLNISMRKLSAIGLLIYALTITFASWDWTMSLEPAWFSSMWGPLFFAQSGLTTLAFVIIVLGKLYKHKPLSDVIELRMFHDLGNLAFAFIILWTYMTFCTFIIIWSANLPEGIMWYQMRDTAGWKMVAVILTAFHFIFPFFLLLSRYTKLRIEFLAKIALYILLIRPLDIFWIVAPTFLHENADGVLTEGVHVSLLDFTTLLAVGGLLIAMFCRILAKNSIIPLHDPRFATEVVPLETAGEHV